MAQVHTARGELVRYDRLTSLDDEVRSSIMETDSMKKELARVQTLNKTIEKKLEAGEQEKNTMNTKVSSLKVKLGVSNANLNVSKDEMESLRTNLNETQIHVARLEERLSAMNTELDRLRDPANPDSNMGIKKHVANDRREIKRLKMEIGVEQAALISDQDAAKRKDFEIKELERYLGSVKDQLHVCETKREQAQENEEIEKEKKSDLLKEYNHIRKERKQYDTRIKHAKIKLGVSLAGQNVNVKLMDDMEKRELQLTRRLNAMEKKYKETFGELDVLKSKDKMTKTALSINDHTTRFTRRMQDRQLSIAKSGGGPVRFTEKSGRSLQNDPKLLKNGDKTESRRPRQQDGVRTTGSNKQTMPINNTVQKSKGVVEQVKSTKTKAGSDKSVQFVPPPKPKLKQSRY